MQFSSPPEFLGVSVWRKPTDQQSRGAFRQGRPRQNAHRRSHTQDVPELFDFRGPGIWLRVRQVWDSGQKRVVSPPHL